MDAVELNHPVDVSKVMGSEGFGIEARVTEDCTASLRKKDGMDGVNTSRSASTSWSKIMNAEPWRHTQLPIRQAENWCEHDYRGTSCQLATPVSDVVNVQKKAGKVPRRSSGCSKRARVAQVEDTTSSAGVDDVKDITDKLGSCSVKFNFPDKIQKPRQKNNFSGKRGDRKNFKVPIKTKFDTFSMKTGLASSNLASGGNNIFGLYGLKSDINDVTKLVEDVSLNELLDGTYKCPSLGREKGRKAANSTENFLHSVKKAFSILPLPRVQAQSFTEIDNCHKNISMNSLAASCSSGDKEDTISTDPSPCNKTQDLHVTPKMPVNQPDFQLSQPKDIIECVVLPPPKDLDSLLLDASKPSSSTRNGSDTRTCKQISRRASLPPFPWSHTHCRTNSDAVKLLSSKSTCQGRWVKIPSISNLQGTTSGCFTDLESLAYDPSLIPSVSKSGNSEGGIELTSHNLSFVEQTLASLAINTKVVNVPQVGHDSPRLLAAAQILYDMANKTSRQNLDSIAKWPKKPSQKAMKARKAKSITKPEELYATPSSALGSDKAVRRDVDMIIPSKRPKLSVVETKKDLNHINGVRKGPTTWSTPRSSRSSPGKTLKDSIVEIRHSTANAVKSMHPPETPSQNPWNSVYKLHKLMPGETLKDSLVEIRHSTANAVKSMHPPETPSQNPWNDLHKLHKLMPGETLKDSLVEIRHSTANAVKSMHPPETPSQIPYNSLHKLHKLMPGEWKRGRDKLD